jgi:hypothetical protein
MLPVSRVIGHKEWAPGRKSDPTYDMNWRRACVAGVRPPQEDDMPLSQDDANMVAKTVWNWVMSGQEPYLSSDRAWVLLRDTRANAAALGADLDALAQRPTGQVDPAPIVAAVVDAITRAGIAEQVVDALGERLARP